MTPTAPLDLRARSKARRRRAIQLAAFQLIAERGYAATTLRDIAEQAEVAPRTISGYFPAKADIAVSRSVELAEALVAVLETDPALDFVDVIDRWLTSIAATMDYELAQAAQQMEEAEPGVATRGTARLLQAQAVGAPRLVAAIGLPPEHLLVPVIARAVGAAISAYVSVLTRDEDTPELRQEFLSTLRTIISSGVARN